MHFLLIFAENYFFLYMEGFFTAHFDCQFFMTSVHIIGLTLNILTKFWTNILNRSPRKCMKICDFLAKKGHKRIFSCRNTTPIKFLNRFAYINVLRRSQVFFSGQQDQFGGLKSRFLHFQSISRRSNEDGIMLTRQLRMHFRTQWERTTMPERKLKFIAFQFYFLNLNRIHKNKYFLKISSPPSPQHRRLPSLRVPLPITNF